MSRGATGRGLLPAILLLAACAARPPEPAPGAPPPRPVEPPAAAAAPAEVPPAAPPPAPSPAPSPSPPASAAATTGAAAAAFAHLGVASSAGAPTTGAPPHGGLAAAGAPPIPPPEPGGSRSAFSGCLQAADEAAAARFAPPPTTRGPTGPPFTVTPAPGGAQVVHTLTHACCLRAQVTTRLVGATAEVHTRLSGEPCRCLCGSTIRTALALPPGAFTVVVDLEDAGGLRRVGQQQVTVR